MFGICDQFPFGFSGRHPAFDLAEMIKLLWNRTVQSTDILARVKAPLKTLEYWKRYYHTPVCFLLFLQQQSLHLLRCRRQGLFTPLMYRGMNLINLPRRHIFISAIWGRARKLGRARFRALVVMQEPAHLQGYSYKTSETVCFHSTSKCHTDKKQGGKRGTADLPLHKVWRVTLSEAVQAEVEFMLRPRTWWSAATG